MSSPSRINLARRAFFLPVTIGALRSLGVLRSYIPSASQNSLS